MSFVFRPRINRVLAVLLVLCILLPLGVGGWLLSRGKVEAGLILLLVGSLDLFLMRVLIWPLRYEANPEALIVHAGLNHFRIPYARIQRITRHHPWRHFSLRAVGFSLSLRYALRIEYGWAHRPNWLIIAPEDPEAFLEVVARYAPMLQRTGPCELTRKKESGHEAASVLRARQAATRQ